MPIKILRGLLASLILLTPLASGEVDAQAVVAVVQPQITYSDTTGVNFLAIPAQWATPQKNSFQWFVNGKAVVGANKLGFKATARQKNQSIQFKEIGSLGTAVSVIGKIGQVIVNAKPSIAFTDSSNSMVKVNPGTVSPKSSKVTYQWYKGPIDITGAKLDTYAPATGDQGFKIYVNAKYSLKGFTDVSVNSDELAVPIVKRTYLQIWQDEFNLAAGSAPDSKIWLAENGDGTGTAPGAGWGNKERQYYIPTLAKITSAGALQIDATTTGANAYNCYYKTPCEWLSSKYITKGKVGFKYGRIEARIKGPASVAGTWGAFWLLGANVDDRPWPWCGEIDITELLGKNPNSNYGTLHGLISDATGRGSIADMPQGFSNEYHTYTIDWLPDQIDWYVDGVLFGSQQKLDKDWVFDHEFYLIMNLAMGGNFSGPVDGSLKQTSMSFDWIRFSTINGVGEVIQH
jgi:beta-glucanase (GH16 family)